MGPASFLKFTTSVAHYIVDDDSDHVLMRMTIPGHLVKRKSKQDDRELASGLTERQADCRHLSGPDKDLSHVVIDAMDEYQNIDQHQVDKVFAACRAQGSKRFDRLQDQ
jgi:hypothetical protein